MVKRILLAVLAVILLLLGGAVAAAAVWANGAFDDRGVMRFDAGTINPAVDARSTIIDVDKFSASIAYIESLGSTQLSVSAAESADPTNAVFFGAAATPDVDAFVKGSSYSVAIKDGSQWTTRDVPGSLLPPLPRDQQFWLAQAVGPQPAITVPADRPLTLLVMNPSAVPTGPITLSIDFVVPRANDWILGMAIAAGVLIVVGLILIVIVIRIRGGRGKRGKHEPGVEEPVIEPVVEAEPEPVVEAEPEPVVEAEPEPVVEAEPEPVVEAEPEPVVEAEPEPVVEAEPEPEPVVEPSKHVDD